MELHQKIEEALECTMDDQDRQNARLKQRIAKLEDGLNQHALFVEPLSIVESIEGSTIQACKIDKANCLLSGVSRFVEKCIKESTYLIYEAFEIVENVHKISTCIRSCK